MYMGYPLQLSIVKCNLGYPKICASNVHIELHVHIKSNSVSILMEMVLVNI